MATKDTKASNNYPEVTETVLTGGGLFDELMRAAKAHVLEEYQQQRIRGADYSKVYLGAMEAVLGNTMQYLLGTMLKEEQKAKLIADTELTKAQQYRLELLTPLEKEKLEAEVMMTELQADRIKQLLPLEIDQAKIQIKLGEAQYAEIMYRVTELLPLEKERLNLEKQKLEFEKDILALQKEKFEYEKKWIWPLEKEKLELERDVLKHQVPLIEAQVGLARAQVSKIMQELKLIPYQIDLMKWQAKTAEVQYGLAKLQRSLVGQQIHKTRQERFLIEARYATEQANWSDGIFTDHFYDFVHEYHHEVDGQGNPVLDINGNPKPILDEDGRIVYKLDSMGRRIRVKDSNGRDIPVPWLPKGLIWRQKALLRQQEEGFDRDAEQKAAKIFADTFSVIRTTDEDVWPPEAMQRHNITRMMQKLASGVEVDLDIQNKDKDFQDDVK